MHLALSLSAFLTPLLFGALKTDTKVDAAKDKVSVGCMHMVFGFATGWLLTHSREAWLSALFALAIACQRSSRNGCAFARSPPPPRSATSARIPTESRSNSVMAPSRGATRAAGAPDDPELTGRTRRSAGCPALRLNASFHPQNPPESLRDRPLEHCAAVQVIARLRVRLEFIRP